MPILGILDSAKTGRLTNFTSIATVTAAGGETSLTLSSIPSTYTDLHLRIMAKDTLTSTAASGGVTLTLNNDTGTNYVFHRLYGNGSSVVADGSTGGTSFAGISADMPYSQTAQANVFGVSIWDFSDYANTSKNKTLRVLSGVDWNTSTTSAYARISSGLWTSTSAITSIQITPVQVAFAAGSTVALYGIKAAA
jgi:hypothetical protein